MPPHLLKIFQSYILKSAIKRRTFLSNFSGGVSPPLFNVPTALWTIHTMLAGGTFSVPSNRPIRSQGQVLTRMTSSSQGSPLGWKSFGCSWSNPHTVIGLRIISIIARQTLSHTSVGADSIRSPALPASEGGSRGRSRLLGVA